MTRNRKVVESALTRKGFEENNSDHKKYIYYTFTGQKTSIWTKISHGSGHAEISPINIKNMANQCHLTTGEFHNLIDCPLSRVNYESQLVSNGHIRS